MKQQGNKTIIRYRDRVHKYKRQRDIVLVAALVIFMVFFGIETHLFNEQMDSFDELNELVDTYRERNAEYFDQIQELTEQVQILEYENRQLCKATKINSGDDQEATDESSKIIFVPYDWELDTTLKAKIYESVPLDEDLQNYTWQCCVYLDIPEQYETCLAIMWQETDFDPMLISSTDDYGIMQINGCNISDLKEQLGVDDIMDTEQNICSGVYLLSLNLKQFGNTNDALMAYNMGPGGARQCLSQGIYSTDYSRSVKAKTQMILQDDYDPNWY